MSYGYWGGGDKTPVHGIGEISRMGKRRFRHLAEQPFAFGHTRWATHGAIAPRNCHPFDFPSCVGAHNGIVHNHTELNAKYGRSLEVDSMHFFAHLEESRPWNDLEAYGAVCFHWREDTDALYFGTFNGGEMAAARVKGFGVVWSSDAEHLDDSLWLAEMTGRPLKIREGILYRAVEGDLVKTDIALEVGKPSSRLKWSDYVSPSEETSEEERELDRLLSADRLEFGDDTDRLGF